MVPSCSPGLFTKQFAELAPPDVTGPGLPGRLADPHAAVTTTRPDVHSTLAATWSRTPGPGTFGRHATGPRFAGNEAPHTFPYLNDEFFYTGGR